MLQKGGTEQETEHVIVPKNTYKMYCGREPRFYISVLYNEEYHWGKDKSNAKNKFANFFSGGEDGGPSHDSPSAGYLIRKRVDPLRFLPLVAVLTKTSRSTLSLGRSLSELCRIII